MVSEKERDEKFVALNRNARLDRFRRLAYEDYGNHEEIEAVYEEYVLYEKFTNFASLPVEQQNESLIDTYEPIRLMIGSLNELLAERSADVGKLADVMKEEGLE